jgi:hypothetical protein
MCEDGDENSQHVLRSPSELGTNEPERQQVEEETLPTSYLPPATKQFLYPTRALYLTPRQTFRNLLGKWLYNRTSETNTKCLLGVKFQTRPWEFRPALKLTVYTGDELRLGV